MNGRSVKEICGCVTLLCLFVSTRTGRATDDFAPPQTDQWWQANGANNLPKLDSNGNLQQFTTRYCYVSTNLIDSHDKDSGGTTRPHIHWQADYDSIADANRYWDARFGIANASEDNSCVRRH